MTGPISISSSVAGSPTLMPSTAFTVSESTSSKIPLLTRIREDAVQSWPELK